MHGCLRLAPHPARPQDLEATLEPMFAAWRDNRKPGEGFGDYTARVGNDGLKAAAAAAAATLPAAAPALTTAAR